MYRNVVNALAACLVTFVLCSLVYPAAVWVAAWAIFPHQAAGSLIERDGKVIGSELIAQPFASDIYFFPRPSAVDYKADATGGSNLGTKNPDLHKKIAERAEALKATADNPVPADLVTASGGGMDPEVSPEAATYQAARVAAARHVAVGKVQDLIDRHTNYSGAIIGAPPRVNVLKLNLALDEEMPAPSSAPKTESAKTTRTEAPSPPSDGAAKPAAASDDVSAIRSKIDRISERIDQMRTQIEAVSATKPPAAYRDLEQQIVKLSREISRMSPLVAEVALLDKRIQDVDGSIKKLGDEMAKNQDSPKPEHAGTVLNDAGLEKAKTPSDLAPALEAFRKGRYAEAVGSFRAITQANPDDARAWYLAAVALGLSTNKWTGEAEDLVKKGVDRERAGTPSAAEIDAAVASLDLYTGRDWLAFYRQSAKR